MEEHNEAMVQKAGGARLKKGGKRPLMVIGILVGVVCAAYVGLCAWAGSLDTFYPNTTINDVAVGGLTVSQAAEQLRQADLNTLTPIEAMNFLYQLKQKL